MGAVSCPWLALLLFLLFLFNQSEAVKPSPNQTEFSWFNASGATLPDHVHVAECTDQQIGASMTTLCFNTQAQLYVGDVIASFPKDSLLCEDTNRGLLVAALSVGEALHVDLDQTSLLAIQLARVKVQVDNNIDTAFRWLAHQLSLHTPYAALLWEEDVLQLVAGTPMISAVTSKRSQVQDTFRVVQRLEEQGKMGDIKSPMAWEWFLKTYVQAWEQQLQVDGDSAVLCIVPGASVSGGGHRNEGMSATFRSVSPSSSSPSHVVRWISPERWLSGTDVLVQHARKPVANSQLVMQYGRFEPDNIYSTVELNLVDGGDLFFLQSFKTHYKEKLEWLKGSSRFSSFTVTSEGDLPVRLLPLLRLAADYDSGGRDLKGPVHSPELDYDHPVSKELEVLVLTDLLKLLDLRLNRLRGTREEDEGVVSRSRQVETKLQQQLLAVEYRLEQRTILERAKQKVLQLLHHYDSDVISHDEL